MSEVLINPKMFVWARERAKRSVESLRKRFPKIERWEIGELYPTLKQLEDYAHETHTPIGFFFLPEPYEAPIPIPDFRTVRNEQISQPSTELLETIYICQQRQDWYRDYAKSIGEVPLDFVGSASINQEVVGTAKDIRQKLNFSVSTRRKMKNWEDAFRDFRIQVEDIGVMVMINGILGNNTHRKLDPQEFRGFSLVDDLAPVIFINGADSKAAQMFTLAHELAHIWLGESALSDLSVIPEMSNDIEVWCNKIAAEILVPIEEIQREFNSDEDVNKEANRLAKVFKVSTLVILRRIFDVGGLIIDELWDAYNVELERIRALRQSTKEDGGNFNYTLPIRASRRFGRALVISTLEGRTLLRDALRMLNINKVSTFKKFGNQVGIA